MLVGLTGGIGSGKSLVSTYLSAQGVFVIDADQVARDVVAVGQDTLEQLVRVFGKRILLHDGSLHRSELRRLAFSSEEARQALNAIMHPAIRTALLAAIQQPKSSEEPMYRLLVAPLLLENGLDALVDVVVVVDVDEKIQLMRAAARDGAMVETIASIMEAQWKRSRRLAFAHAIIDNNGSRDQTVQQAHFLHHYLMALAFQ